MLDYEVMRPGAARLRSNEAEFEHQFQLLYTLVRAPANPQKISVTDRRCEPCIETALESHLEMCEIMIVTIAYSLNIALNC